MRSENQTLRVLGAIVRLALLVVAAMFVVRVAKVFYGYGYEIFAQTPMSEPPGRAVTITVEKGDSVKEIGSLLEDKGLIQEDPLGLLFRLQERFSENHGKIMPGTYELNSAMTPDEMIAVMSAKSAENILQETEQTEGSSELGAGLEQDAVPLPEGTPVEEEDAPEGEDTPEDAPEDDTEEAPENTD